MKIVFVCLGNICRSPLAEAIFNHKIKEKWLSPKFEADSCGTSNYNIGDSPDPRTIKNAGENGVTMQHEARQFSKTDLEMSDIILVMDKNNLEAVLSIPNATLHKEKIKMMREFDPQGRGDVPDPYYGGEKDFQLVFDILDRSIENFITTLPTSK
ncbi:MAG: low molecular weight protein-tyrosine-phosphatase [Cyclobacteriaceae bacterium]